MIGCFCFGGHGGKRTVKVAVGVTESVSDVALHKSDKVHPVEIEPDRNFRLSGDGRPPSPTAAKIDELTMTQRYVYRITYKYAPTLAGSRLHPFGPSRLGHKQGVRYK